MSLSNVFQEYSQGFHGFVREIDVSISEAREEMHFVPCKFEDP